MSWGDMKTKMGARRHARIAMILAASGISLTVVGVLAACTTAPSAGSLADTSERGDVAGAAESVTPMNSGSPQASPTGAVSESGSGQESFTEHLTRSLLRGGASSLPR